MSSTGVHHDEFDISSYAPADRPDAWGSVLDDTHLPWRLDEDVLTPSELAIEAYERAREPKRLVLQPGGHFDAYVNGFDIAGAAASDWLSQHLLVRGPIPT